MPRNEEHPPGPSQQEWFATTHWSLVLAAGDRNIAQSADALEKLCRTYWYPLYAFVRHKGHSSHEAEDLIQEFFAHLLRRNFPHGIAPEGGKFRSYLLRALQHFLTNEWHRARTQKRGSGKPLFSLQELNAEGRYCRELTDHITPQTLYDRRWAGALLEQVRARLRAEYEAQNKVDVYDTLSHCLTGSERSLPYSGLAQKLGCSEAAIKMTVHRMRKRYGDLLRLEISQTVSRPGDVEEEIRSLLAAL